MSLITRTSEFGLSYLGPRKGVSILHLRLLGPPSPTWAAVRRHGPPLAALLTLGLLGVAPLFHPGFPASHDGHHQIVRLMHFHRGLVDGQLPVRWAGTALCAYGYPLFVFTYRLPFWLAELWYLASGNLGDAIKATFVV